MINHKEKSAMIPRKESDWVSPSQHEPELSKAVGLGNAALDTPPARKAVIQDPEVLPIPKRRLFPTAYTARIVEEAGVCTKPDTIGALLRREGLYT